MPSFGKALSKSVTWHCCSGFGLDRRAGWRPPCDRRAAGGERHVRVDISGKESRTDFIPLEQFPQAVLVEVDLGTGRTHQIRVHATSIGHPVAGDERYGKVDDPVVAGHGLQRLFLHARWLEFVSPGTGLTLRIEAPLGADLTQTLHKLRRG